MAARFKQRSIYIDTEGKVSLERLREIATRRAHFFNAQNTMNRGSQHTTASTGLNNSNNNNYENRGIASSFRARQGGATSSVPGDETLYSSPQVVLDSVDIHKPKNVEDLFATLKDVEDSILFRNDEASNSTSQYPVRLLVLDSIAAPIRQDFGTGASAPQRAAAAIQVAQFLKRLADQQNLCVIVINQIGGGGGVGPERSNEFENSASRLNNSNNNFGTNRSSSQLAALGTSWHHCVSTRILLECETTFSADQSLSHVREQVTGTNRPYQHRQATIVKSNMVGQGPPIGFQVTGLGVVDA